MKRTSTLLTCCTILLIAVSCQELSAQWEYQGSPEKGSVSSTRSYGDTLLLTTESGIFYSTDNAASWSSISVPDTFITMQESWLSGQHLFLSSTKVMPPYVITRQLYRTSDWGQSWTDITPGDFAVNAGRKLFIRNDSIVWFGDSTILLSRDFGDTYQIAGPQQRRAKNVFTHQGAFYVFTHDGTLLRTTAFDEPWELITEPFINLNITSISLIDDVLWKVEKDFWLQESYLSRSYDGGIDWVQYDTIATPRGSETRLVGDSQKIFVVSNLDDSFYASLDDGSSWSPFNVPEIVYGVCFHQGMLLLNTTEGVYTSNDNGNSFTLANKGLLAAEIHSIHKAWDALWVSDHEDVFTKSDGSDEWIGKSTWQNLKIADSGYFMAYVDGIPSRSGDGGQTWTTIPSTIVADGENIDINSFRVAGEIYFLNTSDWPRISTDHGETWSVFQENNNDASSIRNAFKHQGRHMVITGHSKILVSTDGQAWNHIDYNLENDFDVHHLTRIHFHSPYYFASGDGSIYRLHQDSAAWIQLASPAPDSLFELTPFSRQTPFISYHDLLITPFHRHGVFISRDYGVSWESITGDLPDFQTTIVSIINDELYLGVHGGVWKRSLEGLTATSDPFADRNCFTMHASADQLTITSESPDAMMDVSIFSADGKMIFMHRNHTAHQPLDISQWPAGWYAAHVRSNDCEKTLPFVKN